MLNKNVGDPAYHSICTLTKGAASFLPKTDDIAFVSLEEGLKLRAKWDAVQLAAPHLFRRQEMYPERWFVDAFPTPEEFQRMVVTTKK